MFFMRMCQEALKKKKGKNIRSKWVTFTNLYKQKL